ncbi:WhiB family transcriptional regulator [Kineococcus radiotolerans]|uniref:WhiB family transcriptional regulator n=1 Tax=Kineococcus radiotolerans TaxID=131568 RepID=UPI0016110169|nr:WhiB family transcriptional regulator [Kineococcus radiotolerans]
MRPAGSGSARAGRGPGARPADHAGAVFDPETLENLPCTRVPPELFFVERPDQVAVAKALCVGCPVRTACLAGARERREPVGIWGGELFVDGVAVAAKRGPGRPRKVPVAV